LNELKDVSAANSWSQGQNLVLTGLFVPSSLDSGRDEGLLDRIAPRYYHLVTRKEDVRLP